MCFCESLQEQFGLVELPASVSSPLGPCQPELIVLSPEGIGRSLLSEEQQEALSAFLPQ